MLGRRQIREKVLQFIYAHNNNTNTIETTEKNLLQSIELIYNLYVYQLNLILAFRKVSTQIMETGKKKNFPTDEELNPNKKFINNRIFSKLEDNKELNEFTSKHSELTWNENDHYPTKIFKKFYETDAYKKYLYSKTDSFDLDKEIIVKIFNKYIAENEDLIEWYEDINLSWADDFHIANAMTFKTVKNLSEDKESHTLIKIFKDNEDRIFAKNLLFQTISHQKKYLEEINKRSNNWNIERIAEIDKIILCMALCEFEFFPENPDRVVINEYIELSKTFSTDKSNIFINGILDKFVKDKSTNH